LQGKNVFLILLFIILGMLAGNVLSELCLLIPVKSVKEIFSAGFDIGFSPATVKLRFISFTLGLRLFFNAGSVLGIIFAILLYRWSSGK